MQDAPLVSDLLIGFRHMIELTTPVGNRHLIDCYVVTIARGIYFQYAVVNNFGFRGIGSFFFIGRKEGDAKSVDIEGCQFEIDLIVPSGIDVGTIVGRN